MKYGVIIILACAIGVCLIWLIVSKIRHGSSCCGEHEESEKRISPGDSNPRHYPYHYQLQIDGMVCGNCVRRVENLFHQREGCLVKVDLGSRTAGLHTQQPVTRGDVINILKETSYTLIDFNEEKEGGHK